MIGEEPVTEPTNIQSKHQKHQAFEAELNANTERLNNIMSAGENLIESNQCAGNDEAVKVLPLNLTSKWVSVRYPNLTLTEQVSVCQVWCGGEKLYPPNLNRPGV